MAEPGAMIADKDNSMSGVVPKSPGGRRDIALNHGAYPSPAATTTVQGDVASVGLVLPAPTAPCISRQARVGARSRLLGAS